LSHEPIEAADDKVLTNRIHRDDLAAALRFLMDKKEESGTFLVTDQYPATAREMAAWLHAEGASSLLAEPPLPRATERARRSRRMQATRLLDLGFEHQFPSFREGYGALLDELRAARERPL
jgi:nucleoside-diphosphate-sugar epimerase